jgi:hypothetical protein
MGLDQYLYARKYISGSDYKKVDGDLVRIQNQEYENIISQLGLTSSDVDDEYPSINLSIKVGYWRKENQIHKWFVDNVQEGEDDCKQYYVSPDQLTDLHNLCKEVLGEHDKAEELLPRHSGFFFGDVEYDEWYFKGLEKTVEILERLLANPKFLGWDFYYDSSW